MSVVAARELRNLVGGELLDAVEGGLREGIDGRSNGAV